MPTNLATNYFGATATAVLLTGGSSTRIYYIGVDGSIHEAAGSGAAVNNPTYSDTVIVSSDKVRINSPLAAVAWNDGQVDQIRLYFIDKSNLLHELCNTASGGAGAWAEGYLSGHSYAAVANSGLLYAVFTSGPNIRVGYQSAANPGVITETTNTSGPWNQGTFH